MDDQNNDVIVENETVTLTKDFYGEKIGQI